MPRFPEFARRTELVTGSVFENFRAKMKARGPDLVRLHIGDTYLPVQYPLPIQPDFLKKYPYANRYCNTFGVERFREVLREKLAQDNHLPVKIENILVTNGATNALSASVQALVNPDEEVLVLTPCWPFFPGMVRMAGATVREAPFYLRLYEEPELDIRSYLTRFLTEKTAALYLNSPNNPSGKVLSRHQLQQVADFARENRLWIISDEAYDGLTFDTHTHISPATLPEMFPQTLSIFTFSKSFMFAGLRLGYLAASPEVIREVNKAMVHQLYSPSTLSQYMMVEPVKMRQTWIPELNRHYRELRDMFVKGLDFPVRKPEGTYFLFFSVREFLHGRTYWQLFDQLMDAGVSVAPGVDFGSDFADYIRICFTGEPPERLKLAIERLNQVLTSRAGGSS